MCSMLHGSRSFVSFRSTAHGWRSAWFLLETSSTVAEATTVGCATHAAAAGAAQDICGLACVLFDQHSLAAGGGSSQLRPLVEPLAPKLRFRAWPPPPAPLKRCHSNGVLAAEAPSSTTARTGPASAALSCRGWHELAGLTGTRG